MCNKLNTKVNNLENKKIPDIRQKILLFLEMQVMILNQVKKSSPRQPRYFLVNLI